MWISKHTGRSYTFNAPRPFASGCVVAVWWPPLSKSCTCRMLVCSASLTRRPGPVLGTPHPHKLNIGVQRMRGYDARSRRSLVRPSHFCAPHAEIRSHGRLLTPFSPLHRTQTTARAILSLLAASRRSAGSWGYAGSCRLRSYRSGPPLSRWELGLFTRLRRMNPQASLSVGSSPFWVQGCGLGHIQYRIEVHLTRAHL